MNSHLSLFPLPHAALFLCFPLFPSPNFSGISSESTRNIKKTQNPLGIFLNLPQIFLGNSESTRNVKIQKYPIGDSAQFPQVSLFTINPPSFSTIWIVGFFLVSQQTMSFVSFCWVTILIFCAIVCVYIHVERE